MILAIVMEEGLAHCYLVSNNNLKPKGKIEQNIPKKKAIDKGHVKKKAKFHDNIEALLDKLVNPMHVGDLMLQSIKAFIVGSPG